MEAESPMPRVVLALLACSLLLPPTSAAQGPPGGFVFIESDGPAAAGELPLYRRVSDRSRLATLARWADNDAARWALDTYRRVQAIAARREPAVQPAEYFIALERGGESTSIGFRVRVGSTVESHPRAAYVRLGPEEWRFVTALLHETGHVALAVLAGGRDIPRRAIAPIPHTVAALTDRGTAFDEGFATHLETLVAHVSAAPEVRTFYRHQQFLFGAAAGMRGEYFHHSADALSFARPHARYGEVRDNDFAFVGAYRGPDYMRAQAETTRDFAELRDADQLLQSEGFCATFFFSVLVRGQLPATPDLIRERQERVMVALSQMFATRPFGPDAPLLIEFAETYRRVFPDDAAELLDVFLDLTHGVFVGPEAASLWREHYLAAVHQNGERLGREAIEAARAAWRSAVMKDSAVLYSRLGPQLRCEVSERSVRTREGAGEAPLAFDVNTAEEGVMRLVPGITETEVASWLAARARQPFADPADFAKRAGISAKALASLRF